MLNGFPVSLSIFCFATKPCQEGEVFLIADGKSYTGEVAAWRSPCILPGGVGRFKAVPFPDYIWARPDKVLMFLAQGAGTTRIFFARAHLQLQRFADFEFLLLHCAPSLDALAAHS